jgi:hypothetical protein
MTPMEVIPPPLPGATAPGLSPQQLAQIAEARQRRRKIHRAVVYALFDGWTIAIFAALTLLGGFFHWIGFVLGAAMALVALVELRGARGLKQLDVNAPRTLAINQLFLGGVLLSYAIYSLWGIYHGRGTVASQLADYPELSALAIDIDQLEKLLAWLIYGTLAAVAVFGMGGTALFYLSRRRHVEAYLRQTPQWIIEAQRAGIA